MCVLNKRVVEILKPKVFKELKQPLHSKGKDGAPYRMFRLGGWESG